MKPARKKNSQKENYDEDGLTARNLAVRMVVGVISHGKTFDEVRTEAFLSQAGKSLAHRDRAFAHIIAASVFREKHALESVLSQFVEKPLPTSQVRAYSILLSAVAQLLILKLPPHAVINCAVSQIRQNRKSVHLAGFTNAVLRRITNDGARHFESLDRVRLSVPDWMWQRWIDTYGNDTAYKIAKASRREPPLDITIKSDPEHWAKLLDAQILATGSLRLATGQRIETLKGYEDGAWWIQDTAATLPARLIDQLNKAKVLDLCAAPGGKSAQLAATGANVTAVEIDPHRCARLRENLTRLKLAANIVNADALEWTCEKQFSAVLLDAPCTATGTLRRHPDIFHLRSISDIKNAAKLQAKLLEKAFQHVAPGGHLVYATCSIEPEEGIEQVTTFLAKTTNASISPVTSEEAKTLGLAKDWITAEGGVQTLPHHDPRTTKDREQDVGIGGMDGFFIVRIERIN